MTIEVLADAKILATSEGPVGITSNLGNAQVHSKCDLLLAIR
jgi:hypothetical protein